MRKYNIESRLKYSFPQDNDYIHFSEFLLATSQNRKFLFLKLSSLLGQSLHYIKIRVYQLDSNGNNLRESDFVYDSFDAEGNSTFVPMTKIEVDGACVNVQCKLIKAQYDLLHYDNGQVQELLDTNYSAPTNGVKKDFDVRSKDIHFPYSLACIALALVLIISVISYLGIVSSYNKYERFTLDNYTYSFANGEYAADAPIIIEEYLGNGNAIVIPEKINEHPIVAINNFAFAGTTIESIKFDGEIVISHGAFSNCSSLTSINLSNVTYIGTDAFRYCNMLSDVTIVQSVLNIGDFAFRDSGVQSVVVSESSDVLNIGQSVFCNCNNLNSFVSNRVIVYDDDAEMFSDCGMLKTLKLLNLNTTVSDLFDYNSKTASTSLETIELSNLAAIDEAFFQGYTSLHKVTIGNLQDSVIYVGAFKDTPNLSEFNIDKRITKVEPYAFFNSGISSFDFGMTEYIGESAFSGSKIYAAELPDSLNYLGAGAFQDDKNLVAVKLSKSLTEVPEAAFDGCTNLTSVVVPSDGLLTTIGRMSFSGTKIQTIELPNSITQIGESAFSFADKLKSIAIPSKVSVIPDNCFNSCISLTSIIVDDSNIIESIGSSSFSQCWSLTNFDTSKLTQLKEIKDYAFTNCSALSRIVVPDDMEHFGKGAFYGCQGLVSFNYPSGIAVVPDELFCGCINLEAVTFNSDIVSFGDEAFYSNRKLKYVEVPSSVTTIGNGCFTFCDAIIEITLPFVGAGYVKDNPAYDKTLAYIFGNEPFPTSLKTVNIYNENEVFDRAFLGASNIEKINYALPIERIGNYAFSYCSSIKEINLSDSLDVVGNNAFEYCESLTEIDLHKVTSIGSNVFKNDNKLTQITVPFIGANSTDSKAVSYLFGPTYTVVKNITVTNASEIADDCFSGLYQLETLSIAGSLEKIGKNILHGCSALKELTIPSLFEYTLSQAFAGSISNNLKKVVLTAPSSMADSIFENCFGIEEVQILGDALTVVPSNAFYGCASLKSTTLSASVVSLGVSAFAFCNNLGSITLPTSLESIGDNCFRYCSSLQEIEIPETVSSIGSNVLQNCNALTSVKVPFIGGSIDFPRPLWYLFDRYSSSNYNLPTSLTKVEVTKATTIAESCFCNASNLKKITLSDDLTSIPTMAFYYCRSLESFTVPSNVVSIGVSAFQDCRKLHSIELNKKLSIINESAFANCYSLLEVMNKSQLMINKGEYSNGQVASCAILVTTDEKDRVTFYHDDNFEYALYDYVYITDYIGSKSEVTLPSDVTYNGNTYNQIKLTAYALAENSILTKIEVPKEIVYIDRYCFAYDDNLEEIVFASDSPIVELPSYLCYYDISLSSITLPDGLMTFGNCSLAECVSLECIVLPSNLFSINWDAFFNDRSLLEVYNLSSLDIRPGIDNYGRVAYYALAVYNSLDAEREVKRFTYGSFDFVGYQDNYSLVGYRGNDVNISLPEQFEYNGKVVNSYVIAQRAFEGKNLSSVVISDAVTKIEDYAFYSNYNLNNIDFSKATSLVGIGEHAFNNMGMIDELDLSSAVKLSEIGNYSFAWSYNLKTVRLPNSLQVIKDGAFAWCNSLTDVEIPSNSALTTICYRAFDACSSLARFVVPTNVTTIGSDAFDGCSNLIEIVNKSTLNIVAGAEDNGKVAYYALVVTTDDSENLIKKFVYDGFNFVAYGDKCILSSCDSYQVTNALPKEVVFDGHIYNSYEIAEGALESKYFEYSDLVIPSSVTSIGPRAFRYAGGLRTLSFEEGTTISEIPQEAFYNSNNLVSVSLPNSITKISNNAFAYCYKLFYVSLSDTLAEIDAWAFSGDMELCIIVNDNESLNIMLGASTNGEIAKYAKLVLTKSEAQDYKLVEGQAVIEDYYVGFNGLMFKNELYVNAFNDFFDYSSSVELPTKVTVNDTVYSGYHIIGRLFSNNLYSLNRLILPENVTMVNDGYIQCFSSQSPKIYYKGTKEQWMAKTDYLPTNICYYVDCVHFENEWTYVNGNISTEMAQLQYVNKMPSSCVEQGYDEAFCPLCNSTVVKYLPLVNHSFVDDVCSMCGGQKTVIDENNYSSFIDSTSSYYSVNGSTIKTTNTGVPNTTATIVCMCDADVSVSFDYLCICGDNDYFTFSINDTVQITATGSAALPVRWTGNCKEGDTFKFSYVKDNGFDWNSDCVIISNLTLIY